MLKYGFYNSINNDRKYNAEEMSSMFDGIIGDGVLKTVGDKFNSTATGGMNITIGTGRAWFNHTWTNNDAPIVLSVSASEVALNRIDTVVLEVNSDDAVRANSIKIIKGTPATLPVAPTLVSTDFVHQYPLCDIYVAKSATEITQANITNKVGTTDCPYATAIVEQGIVRLDGTNKIPASQIPTLDYLKPADKGAANGVASLGADKKIPTSQIPVLDYMSTDQKGVAGGVATLNANAKIPLAQIPESVSAVGVVVFAENKTTKYSGGYFCYASGSTSGYLPTAMVDGTTNSSTNGWKADTFNSAWSELKTNQKPIKIWKYVLYTEPSNGNGAPKSWTVEGSDDETNWTLIDVKANYTWPSSGSNDFPVSPTKEYLYYRLNIVDTYNSGYPMIREFELYQQYRKTQYSITAETNIAAYYDGLKMLIKPDSLAISETISPELRYGNLAFKKMYGDPLTPGYVYEAKYDSTLDSGNGGWNIISVNPPEYEEYIVPADTTMFSIGNLNGKYRKIVVYMGLSYSNGSYIGVQMNNVELATYTGYNSMQYRYSYSKYNKNAYFTLLNNTLIFTFDTTMGQCMCRTDVPYDMNYWIGTAPVTSINTIYFGNHSAMGAVADCIIKAGTKVRIYKYV